MFYVWEMSISFVLDAFRKYRDDLRDHGRYYSKESEIINQKNNVVANANAIIGHVPSVNSSRCVPLATPGGRYDYVYDSFIRPSRGILYACPSPRPSPRP